MADREQRRANTAQTRFPIASLGKMFTAVAIAQLVQQHRLSFTDTIGTHLARFPPQIAGTVTIHQLLTQTSGMGDAALIRQRYADYVREHIFTPADMTDTDIRVYRPSQIPGMASGYMLVGQDGQPLPRRSGQGSTAPSGSLRANDEVQLGNPSGGAWSTVGDLLRFAQALTGHRLLGPALTATVLAGKVATNRPGPGEDTYAYGFVDSRINGVRIVGHNGGSPGYEAQLDLYPDRGWTVGILTNQDQVLPPAIQRSQQLLTRSP